MADQNQPDQNNVGGRPLKFETVAELRHLAENYFKTCDPHTEIRRVFKGNDQNGTAIWEDREIMTSAVPYTITGLARALKTTRETLLDYESGKYDDRDDTDPSGERFSDTIKDAKLRVQQNAEELLMSGMPATGPIFWLKNNAGWRDRQEIDHTSKDRPIPLLAGLAPDKLEVEDDAPSADDGSHKDQ